MLGPVAEKERLEAAGAYGQAGPLSDLIIAERDDVWPFTILTPVVSLSVTSDNRLIEISTAEGLISENPNNHP